MDDDFIERLIRANGELIESLQWSIDHHQLASAAHLKPVAQTFSAILTQMIDRYEESLASRSKTILAEYIAGRVAVTTPSRITGAFENPAQKQR